MRVAEDKKLVLRCLARDRRAWDEFVERFAPLIYWAIRMRLHQLNLPHSREDVQDIFQNVFILLWEKKKLAQIRNREHISGWLSMVAANCTSNYFRHMRQELWRSEFSAELLERGDCVKAEVIPQKLKELITEVLSHLPPRERIIMQLCYLYEKTHQEIARILKMPLNSVSSIIQRTKEKLKRELEKQGLGNF